MKKKLRNLAIDKRPMFFTKSLKAIYYTLIILVFTACVKEEATYDASGSFEAIERIISAEATGKIQRFDIEEGEVLAANKVIGQIDVSLLKLQSEQVEASVQSINEKTNNATPQIKILQAQLISHERQVASLNQQLIVLDKEVKRFQNLVAAKAAPQKKLDDLLGQQSVLQKQLAALQTQGEVIEAQINSTKSTVNTQNRAILSEVAPTKKRLDLLAKQINDGIIINEYPGTVLAKYAYDGEFASLGKPLYKIADLSVITLRVYLTGNQLAQVKLNDKVIVSTDDGKGGFKETEGTISWISSKAEFTPKTIQTKDERANLVYATKVKVANDGTYKIGMYGEIKFKTNE